MRKLISAIICFTFFSCTSNLQKIKGELYFKLVNITSPEGMSKIEADNIREKIKTVKITDNLTPQDKDVVDYFIALEKNNLLESPFIYLKKSEEIKKIFLSKEEYQKIKSFTLSDLNKKGKKVIIELEIKSLEGGIDYSENIIDIKETDGITLSHK